jgi:hypothetical protein
LVSGSDAPGAVVEPPQTPHLRQQQSSADPAPGVPASEKFLLSIASLRTAAGAAGSVGAAASSLRELQQATRGDAATAAAACAAGTIPSTVAALKANGKVVCEAAILLVSLAKACPGAYRGQLVAADDVDALVAALRVHPADRDVASEAGDALAAVVAAAGPVLAGHWQPAIREAAEAVRARRRGWPLRPTATRAGTLRPRWLR